MIEKKTQYNTYINHIIILFVCSLQVSRRLERERDGVPDNQQRFAVRGRLEETLLYVVRQMASGPRTGVRVRGQLQPEQQPDRGHGCRRRSRPVV